MNQSVYKRDFRDPRDMSLWKFLLNGECKSNVKDNVGDKRASRALDELTIKHCRCKREKDIARTKSAMVINNDKEKEMKMELKSSKSMPCLPTAAKKKNLKKFKISDFPTIIDRFIPKNEETISQSMNRTEYRDVFNRIGDLIIKHKIHNHSKCGRDGKYCEHAIHALTRRQKMY